MVQSVTETTSYEPDNFFTGHGDVETAEKSVKVGQNIVAKQVLALETTTGKYVTYAAGGANGTGVAVAIAAYDIDATAAEMSAQLYVKGTFNPEELVFSGTPTDVQKAGLFVGTPIQLQTPQL